MQWNSLAQDVLNKYSPGWKGKNILKDLLEQERIVFENKHPDTGEIHSAYGYGQITRTTARGLSKEIFGEEDPSKRFDPGSNIRMTIYYLKKLAITPNQDIESTRSALLEYTGASGGDRHIDRILN